MAEPSERGKLFWMIGLLCTGTTMSLAGQLLTSHGIHASAQYFINFVYGMMNRKPRSAPITARQSRFITAIGICHVSAFLVVTPALEKIGVALYQMIYSSGLVLTAFISLAVLRKMPSAQQWLGIACCTAGLMQRGYVMASAGGVLSADKSPEDTLVGVALAFLVTLLFCMVPILVEIVNKGQPDQKKLSSADIGAGVARVGAGTLTVYMVVHTIPNWNELVAEPLTKTGVSPWEVGAVYVGNGLLYLLHSAFYLETARTAGAVGNGLVNAVRSATVVLGGWALFCGDSKPHLCLDQGKLITVGLLMLGGIIYTTSPPSYYLDDVKKQKQEKKDK